MSQSSHYQGSQAFSMLKAIHEQVNPNTGSLALMLPLVRLNGLRKNISLEVDLHYTQGAGDVFGLPKDWSLSLPYLILTPDASSITWHGNTSILDPSWENENGYQSGLRYINNHGIKFEQVIPPQPLPSEDSREYSYQLRTERGTHLFFDALGRLIEKADRFGNPISYYYIYPDNENILGRLDYIIDSYGQKVSFAYEGQALIVALPSGATKRIDFTSRGVQRYTNELGYITEFEYDNFNNNTAILRSIKYPTGLETQLQYTSIDYRTEKEGVTKSFPAVEKLIHMDSNNKLVDHTTYTFGYSTGGNTFTGYADGYVLSSSHDSLMDSNDTSYRYDTLVRRVDENDNVLMATQMYFNYLHLPVQIDKYLINDKHETTNGYQTIYEYKINLDMHARSTNFNKPSKVQQQIWSDKEKSYVLLSVTTHDYNDFGKVLKHEVYNENETTPQLTTLHTYTETCWGGEMAKTKEVQDHVGDSTKRVMYVLTSDEKNIKTQMTECRDLNDSAWRPWKTNEMNYDKQGRILSITLKWSDETLQPLDSIKSTTKRFSYEYDTKAHQLEVITTNDLGNSSSTVHAINLTGAPKLKVTNALNKTIRYEYDALGRLKQIEDPCNRIITYAYQVAQNDGVNSVTVTHPTGYVVTKIQDSTGRVVKTMDNGLESKPKSNPTRIINEMEYNLLGKIASEKNRLGLAVYYEYDALERLKSKKDHFSNEMTVDYETITATRYVNGIKRRWIKNDGLGRRLELHKYPYPEKNEKYYVQYCRAYNGFGQVISACVFQQDLNTNNASKLLERTSRYNADGQVITDDLTGFLDHEVNIQQSTFYNLLGQTITRERGVSYKEDNKKYNHTGDINIYNTVGQLIKIKNALGQVKNYTYDAAGNKEFLTRFDGTKLYYTYTNDNRLKTQEVVGNDGLLLKYDYDDANRVKTVSRAEESIEFTYYLDGSPQSKTFSDGNQQNYQRDAYSRLQILKDPSDAETTYTYNDYGQIKTKQHKSDILTYHYDEVNGVKGKLTQTQLAGLMSFTRSYGRNGFGVINQIDIIDEKSNESLFKSDQEYDALRRIKQVTQTMRDMSFTTTYVYDGLNQLRTEDTYTETPQKEHNTVDYEYDGNGNVLLKTINIDGQTEKKNYHYNAIDQLDSPEIKYDVNGRMLNNGLGYQYTYNEIDQLIQVTKNEQAVVDYHYYPDGLLRMRTAGKSAENFYYSGGIVNAIKDKEESWTSFLSGERGRVSAYHSQENPFYYFIGHGSTGGSVQNGKEHTYRYAAYGEEQGKYVTSGEGPTSGSRFLWKQEFNDGAVGLVYLRSRFYHPGLMRFISMDSYPLSNKYNFGYGDPINQFDPSGHQPRTGAIVGDIVGMIAGAVGVSLGIAALAVTGGASTAAIALGFSGIVSGSLGVASGGVGLAFEATGEQDEALKTISTVFTVASCVTGIFSIPFSGSGLCIGSTEEVNDILEELNESVSTDDQIGELAECLDQGALLLGESHNEGVRSFDIVRRLINTGGVRGVSMEVPSEIVNTSGELVANPHRVRFLRALSCH